MNPFLSLSPSPSPPTLSLLPLPLSLSFSSNTLSSLSSLCLSPSPSPPSLALPLLLLQLSLSSLSIQDSFSLLAYTDPHSSPVGYLLDPIQREPVCAALNSAILESKHLPGQPPLEFALGQAVQCLKHMSRNGLGSAAFTGVQDIVLS